MEAPLDEFLPFRRSSVNDYGESGYEFGPRGDDDSHDFYDI